MLAAEMIQRSSAEVWSRVETHVTAFMARWHKPGRIDRAIRFAIMTGRPEFSELVWPFITTKDSQSYLRVLRHAPRFRPSVLGADCERQRHLHVSGRSELVEVAPYLTHLCASLAGSMLGEGSPDMLKVIAENGTVTSAEAVSLGLIVTELLINALKHAFPHPSAADAVAVRYETHGADWSLSVSDNGVGQKGGGSAGKGGLGTSLVKALAHQLGAVIETTTGPPGMRVSIVHSKVMAGLPLVA